VRERVPAGFGARCAVAGNRIRRHSPVSIVEGEIFVELWPKSSFVSLTGSPCIVADDRLASHSVQSLPPTSLQRAGPRVAVSSVLLRVAPAAAVCAGTIPNGSRCHARVVCHCRPALPRDLPCAERDWSAEQESPQRCSPRCVVCRKTPAASLRQGAPGQMMIDPTVCWRGRKEAVRLFACDPFRSPL
jgi:hypothetical protein